MSKLNKVVQRGSMLGAAVALFAATIVPSVSVFADALNPLTDRSLTLSSSSPGWSFTDGSGNATYAPPNSGANGQKTGNTFEFKVSTDSSGSDTSKDVKAFSFQYCTTSAGDCMAPGDNAWQGTGPYTGRETNAQAITAGHLTSDLTVVTSSPSEVDNTGNAFVSNAGVPTAIPNRDDSEGNYIVLVKDIGDANWSQSTGWTMASSVQQGSPFTNNGTIAAGTSTNTANYITLKKSSGNLSLQSGASVKIIFYATDANYLTNPGSGAFFVKINNYNSTTTLDNTTVVDGGVTVANVMNQSIWITTKVLETMDFSVGTVDPYTLDSTDSDGGTPGVQSQLKSANGQDQHGQCDSILTGMTPADEDNILQLGNQTAESSLSTSKTYSTHSYWRLSSNSSAGATVYYSGYTLKNTVNDEIQAIGTTPSAPVRGTPQFGLAIANATTGTYAVDYTTEREAGKVFENGADNSAAGLADPENGAIHSSVTTDITAQGLAGYHSPRLFPLVAHAAYDKGSGSMNGGSGEYGAVNTEFAFDANSALIPAAIASESDDVVDCVTAKMRYIANIAATTPAGIYTTKINYIAAPQY